MKTLNKFTFFLSLTLLSSFPFLSVAKEGSSSNQKPKQLTAKEKQDIKDYETERSVDKIINELMKTLNGFSKCSILNPNESLKICKSFISQIRKKGDLFIPTEKLMTLKKIDENKDMIPFFISKEGGINDSRDTKLSDLKKAQDDFEESCKNFIKIKSNLAKKNNEKNQKKNDEDNNPESPLLIAIKADYDKANGGKTNSYFEKFCLPIVTFMEYLNDISSRPRTYKDILKIKSDSNLIQVSPSQEVDSSGQ